MLSQTVIFIPCKVHGSGSYCVDRIVPDCIWRRGRKEHSWQHCHRRHLNCPWSLSHSTTGMKSDWSKISFLHISWLLGCCYWPWRLCLWGRWVRVNVLSSIQGKFSNRSYWRWSNPDARDTVDELDWERTAATDGGRFPLTDHTTGTEGGFFMQVLDSLQPSSIPTKMMCRS